MSEFLNLKWIFKLELSQTLEILTNFLTHHVNYGDANP